MVEHGWEWGRVEDVETYSTLAKSAWLPKEACNFTENTNQRDIAKQYLLDRGFDDAIIKNYNLKFAVGGAYNRRVIIPVYFEGNMVAFTSRDYTGRQNRYKHSPLFMCSRRIKDSLYNYDNVVGLKHSYLLEGPPDVWELGNSMAVFKSALSSKQRALIMRLNLSSLTIIFDPNATARAYDAAGALSPFIPTIRVIRLTGLKDVPEIGANEILMMEKETPIYRG